MKYCLRFLSLITFTLVLNFFTTPTFAAAPDGLGPWADNVLSFSQGLMKNGLPVPGVRSNPSSALGVAENTNADGTFYSLGFGGKIALGFDNGISSGVIIVEATNPGYPNEKAKVEVSENGTTWVVAGEVTQDGQVNKPQGISCAKYVRVTDISNPADFSDATADGYDVDGVQAQGEPCTPPKDDKNCTCGNLTVNQTNNSNVQIAVNSKAKTGKNKANKNTGGTTNITTGNATNNVAITVAGASNTLTTNPCCCDSNGNSIVISNNGSGSTNTATITNK